VSDSVEVLVSGGPIPTFAHPGDAGADLYASEKAVIPAGERLTVGTGVSVALPQGYAAFVVPRSGLAAKHGITIVNSPGTVDAGYRGEIRVTLLNTDRSQDFEINVGDRIAQLIVMPISRPRFIEVERLPESHRGEGGFGSTGVSSHQANGAAQ
jgi:dUTP pyrophosphatase